MHEWDFPVRCAPLYEWMKMRPRDCEISYFSTRICSAQREQQTAFSTTITDVDGVFLVHSFAVLVLCDWLSTGLKLDIIPRKIEYKAWSTLDIHIRADVQLWFCVWCCFRWWNSIWASSCWWSDMEFVNSGRGGARLYAHSYDMKTDWDVRV